MGYWFYNAPVPVSQAGSYPPALLLLGDSGDTTDFTPPDDQVLVLRAGQKCGSGPYFKQVRHPYCDSTYSWQGSTYSANDVPIGWTRSDWRGYQGGGRILTGTHAIACNFTVNTTTQTIVQFSYLSSWIWSNGGKYYYCSATTSLSGNSNGQTSWGPFGIVPQSWGDVEKVVQGIMNYFGLPVDAATNPQNYGSLSTRYGYPASQASVTHGRTITALDKRWNWRNTSKPSIKWMWDDIPNRVGDWNLLCFGVIPGRIRNAAATALANTMGGLPEVSANSIANVLECANALEGIANTAKLGVRGAVNALVSKLRQYKDPRNDWLSWRYVYNTTKMDIADYKEVTNRLINMTGQPTFKVHGSANGDGFTVRCVKQYRTSDFDIAGYDTRRLLRTYGFRLSAYNMWDMVPFSFIVDWFAHVGPALELAQNWNRHFDFQAVETWYSYREQFEHSYIYFRWANTDPSIPPSYVPTTTSKRTFLMRLADTISIFS